jgi:hypothetical protein
MPALRRRFTRLTATSRFVRRLPALAMVAGALLVPSTALAATHVKLNVTAPSHTLVPSKTLHVTVKATYGGHAATGKAYYRFYVSGGVGFQETSTTQTLKNGKTVFSIKPKKSQAEQAVAGQEGGLKFTLYITAKTSHGNVTTKFPVKFKLK